MSSFEESELAKRLRNFSAMKSAATALPEQPKTAVPLGLGASSVDPEQELIDRFNRTVPKFSVLQKFASLPQITDNLQVVTTDFPDNKRLHDIAVVLARRDVDDIVELGRTVIPMIASGFSQRGVGALFVLAFHLRDPADNECVFNDDDAPINEDDKELEDLADGVFQTRTATEVMPATEHPEHEAQAYSYLAASLLRLFTKSEDNYIRAFNHIVLGYQRFYGYALPVNPPQPTIEAIRTLSHHFSHNLLFRSTLYRMLYMGGGIRKAEELRKSLYEIHLANAGMHIVSIFVRLCGVLDCEPGTLMSLINSKECTRQIDSLVTMIELIAKNDDEHSRRTWRFGRIFDKPFMAPLQTKACPQLVYILASALKGVSSKTNQDILNIAQLADVNPTRRRRLTAAGEMIVKMIRQHHASSSKQLSATTSNSLLGSELL